MTIQLNFDATQVEPTTPFEALPADNYIVSLVAAKVQPTADKQSHYMNCDFVVQEGRYKGRHLFENMNLWHATSEKAVQIAWRKLSGLCHAAGVLQVATVDQLYGIPVSAKVSYTVDPQYGPQNDIKAFSKAGEANVPDWNAPRSTNPNPNPPWMHEAPAAAPTPTAAPVVAPVAPVAPAALPAAPVAPAAPPWAAVAPAAAAAPGNQPPWARQ